MIQLILFVGLAACSIVLGAGSYRSKSPQPVMTSYSTVQGTTSNVNDAVAVYKGIPFATPPFGELRWRESTSPSNWTETLSATSFGADCAQSYSSLGIFSSRSEDIVEYCLYMNIWVPTRHIYFKSRGLCK
jgi:carboxylesterase 2